MLLENTVAVVTGGASPRGIGRATAKAMAAQGARIAIVDLDQGKAQEAAGAISTDHRGYGCDVRDLAQCRRTMDAIAADFGRIDSLLNFAGISRSTRFLEVSAEEYQSVMDINLRGTVNMCQVAIPHMIDRKKGAIICVGSIAAQRGGGVFGAAHYSASKGGVQSLAKALAREFGPKGIRVNALAPGLIETDIFEGKLTDERKAEIKTGIPLGRIDQPDDIAHACVYLCSDWASFVTGIVLDVNGGHHIH